MCGGGGGSVCVLMHCDAFLLPFGEDNRKWNNRLKTHPLPLTVSQTHLHKIQIN